MNDAQMTEAVTQLTGVLWGMALLILLVAAHVLLGYLRNAVRARTPLVRAGCVAAAALSFGTTVCGAMALGIGSEGLQYPVGFAPLGVFLSWAVACGVAALAMLPLLRWNHGAALTAGGAVLGCGIVASRVLLLQAVQPRPGIDWSYAALAISALVGVAGCIAGCWIGLRHGARGRLRRGWRWMAAGAVCITMMAAQELALAAAALQTQRASLQQAFGVPLGGICIAAALVLPIALALLQMDLYRRTVVFEGEKRAERRERRRRRREAGAA